MPAAREGAGEALPLRVGAPEAVKEPLAESERLSTEGVGWPETLAQGVPLLVRDSAGKAVLERVGVAEAEGKRLCEGEGEHVWWARRRAR